MSEAETFRLRAMQGEIELRARMLVEVLDRQLAAETDPEQRARIEADRATAASVAARAAAAGGEVDRA